MEIKKTDWFEKELKKLDNDNDSLAFKYILDFSENILEILDKKGIKNKNKYLAEKLNCSPAYISKLFNGKSNFTVKKLVELARAVDYNLNISLRSKISFVRTSPVIHTHPSATVSINAAGQLENFPGSGERKTIHSDNLSSVSDYIKEPSAA